MIDDCAFENCTGIENLEFPQGLDSIYGAQNEAYMSRSAEKLVRGLCFNELGIGG